MLPSVIKHLYYRTDVDALVLVVDSNSSPVHLPAHDRVVSGFPECRLCRLRSATNAVLSHVRRVPGRSLLKLGIGLAVPSIEAWYRCGVDAHVTEAAWLQGLESGTEPYSRTSLKCDTYGTDRPSLSLETTRAIEEAQRLAADLSLLETYFPNGFVPLSLEVRSWIHPR